MKRNQHSLAQARALVGALTCFTFSAVPAMAQFDWGGAAGRGMFEQSIKHQAIVDVGEIPEGLQEVAIHLSSVKDVDVQLIDQTTGTRIVAWPDGLLRGPDRQEINYRGMTIVYSGYNGDGRGLGKEYILITTNTTRPLLMKAFGYQAGFATVSM